MIRGTTPTLSFELPMEVSELSEAWITFAQEGTVKLNKLLSDCSAEGKRLTLRLTQEETLSLSSDVSTKIQIRARTESGAAVASKIITVDTDRILRDGVI